MKNIGFGIFHEFRKRPKKLLKMKLTVVLLLAGLLQVSAISYSQVTRLSLNISGKQVAQVLREIEEKSEFRFFYQREQVDVERRVDIHVVDETIEVILAQLFPGDQITHKIYADKLILIAPAEVITENPQLVIQPNRITGTVTDESGAPLIGVTVSVKGTSHGTITNAEGKYSLSDIPDGATLVFSFVGMESREVPVDNQTTINTSLVRSLIDIDEVVVVGYGVQKKVNLTGSVSVVDFNEIMESRPITNASQALGGTTSGVWVTQSSGLPGGDGAQLRIRGWGTLNNSNPLILIDGIEGSFGQLNPNDIENISVLKDAASAAIYGSKAANGVVLITTKTGKTNDKMEVSLSVYNGIQSLGRRYDMITDGAEFMRLTNQGHINNGRPAFYHEELIEEWENATDKYKYPNTDWFKETFTNAPIQEYDLSIRGGTQKTASFISFNYLSQDGMLPNNRADRYGIRANTDMNVNSWFKLSSKINYTRKVAEQPYQDRVFGEMDRIFHYVSVATPTTAPYTRDGKLGTEQAFRSNGQMYTRNRTPLVEAANGLYSAETDYLAVNVSAKIEFAESLTWNTTLASTGASVLSDNYNSTVYNYTDAGDAYSIFQIMGAPLEMKRSQVSTLSNNLFSTLNFNYKFGENHHVAAIAGTQFDDRKIRNVSARKTDPSIEGLTQVDAGTDGETGSGNMNRIRMASFFGRLNYSFVDKYLFEATSGPMLLPDLEKETDGVFSRVFLPDGGLIRKISFSS